MIPLLVALAALLVLSVRSALVAGGASRYTAWGWWLTVAYALYVLLHLAGIALPEHGEYVFLAALTVAFVVAGVKDEAQAEPWWWPVRRGPTRAERRRA